MVDDIHCILKIDQDTPNDEIICIKTLQEKTWPGNIREFRNLVERLIILGSKEISSQDVRQFS